MTEISTMFAARTMATAHSMAAVARKKIDASIVRYDAWFLVLLAVLLVLAYVIATALAVWCVVYQRKKFTGQWRWSIWGVSVWTECV